MTKQEQRRHEWAARIADYEASGQTMKSWCETKNVTKDQLKYWLRVLRARPVDAANAPVPFLPLALHEPVGMQATSPLLLHVGGVRVEVRNGFDPKLLREVVSALAVLC